MFRIAHNIFMKSFCKFSKTFISYCIYKNKKCCNGFTVMSCNISMKNWSVPWFAIFSKLVVIWRSTNFAPAEKIRVSWTEQRHKGLDFRSGVPRNFRRRIPRTRYASSRCALSKIPGKKRVTKTIGSRKGDERNRGQRRV